MSKLRNFSICLSDLPKSAIYEAKNGKKYISLTSYDNDEPDQYGNDYGIWISQSKEERERKEKRTYVGNGKIIGKNEAKGDKKEESTDGLPF